jgi:hypothetical protein
LAMMKHKSCICAGQHRKTCDMQIERDTFKITILKNGVRVYN